MWSSVCFGMEGSGVPTVDLGITGAVGTGRLDKIKKLAMEPGFSLAR